MRSLEQGNFFAPQSTPYLPGPGFDSASSLTGYVKQDTVISRAVNIFGVMVKEIKILNQS